MVARSRPSPRPRRSARPHPDAPELEIDRDRIGAILERLDTLPARIVDALQHAALVHPQDTVAARERIAAKRNASTRDTNLDTPAVRDLRAQLATTQQRQDALAKAARPMWTGEGVVISSEGGLHGSTERADGSPIPRSREE